ncbi:MAG: hypothetical protein WD356_07165 [Pseudomonadales bacterium]
MNTFSIVRKILYLVLFITVSQVSADPPPGQYIQFQPGTAKGVIYYPDPEIYPNPKIATIAMHRTGNFLNHISTQEMPKRGIIAMGMNPVCENNEARCTPWENNALVVKQGIEYLRNEVGVEKVVLIAHSGGGPTMAFYQAIAENGVEMCQQPQRLVKCGDHLADLPPADGVIFYDAHIGNGIISVRSINPAVMNDEEILYENAAPRIDPKLDPFNPANGFNPNGASSFSDEFKETYFEAQSRRLNKLTDIALEIMEQIEAGTHQYPDDAPFIIPMGAQSRLMSLDPSIHHSTNVPRKLLKNDGSIEDCCVVESVRPPMLRISSPESHKQFWGSGGTRGGTRFLTVRSFLSVRAIRSSNSLDGIDYCTSNNSTICNVRQISVPVQVTAMTGHYFVRNSEVIYENVASSDKDFIAIEGATHGGRPCRDCMPAGQEYDGRYDNVVKNEFDYLANWINERF